MEKLTDKIIYQMVIDELKTYVWGKWICNSLNRLRMKGLISDKTHDRLVSKFQNPELVPLEFRGKYWVGKNELWEEDELDSRIKYLEYLIEQL